MKYRVVKRDITETVYEVEVDDPDNAIRAASERWGGQAQEISSRYITEYTVRELVVELDEREGAGNA